MWPLRTKSAVEREADAAYARVTRADFWVRVLPWGWCLHVFPPGVRHDTFLARCAATRCFAGLDWSVWGWRLVLLRINHLPRPEVIARVQHAEGR